MDKYTAKLYPGAYRDSDEIYSYIAENLSEVKTAEQMIDSIEEAIFNLEIFPERGPHCDRSIRAERLLKMTYKK